MRSIKIVIVAIAAIALIVLALKEFRKDHSKLKEAERTGYDYAQLIKQEESEGTHRLYEHVVMPIQTINLKSQPKEKSGNLVKLDVNSEIVILSWDLINSNWLKAEYNNKTGYLDSRLVTIRPQSVNIKCNSQYLI